MQKEYKVADLASILGITMKTVYRMIERGDVKVSDKVVNNRKMTMVLLTDIELEEFKKTYGKMTVNYPVNDVDCNETLTDNEHNLYGQNQYNQINPLETINKLVDSVMVLQSQVNDYSVKAGQTMLLTDNLLQKEKDLDYWKEQYFQLKSENDRLKSDLEAEKKRPFWKRKV